MSILVGFTLDGVASSSVGLYCDTPQRIIKPKLRDNEYVILGRSGSIDYDDDTYDNITISCKLAYRADSLTDMRSQQRDVAEFLARSGQLIFDDEPDKAYQAKVVSAVSLEEAVRVGTLDVDFICQPFAEAIDYTQVVRTTALPLLITPNITGTRKTTCVIRILATTAIDDIKIIKTSTE